MDKFGEAKAEAIAVAAGTNLAYFKQLARRQRYPSVKLAKRLIKSSGGKLDLLALIDRETEAA